MNVRIVPLLFMMWLPPAVVLAADIAAASRGGPVANAQHLEWVDLIPEIERSAYRAGPPAPVHDYLDGFRSRSFGRSERDDRSCSGVAARLDPDCEDQTRQSISGNINESLNGKTVQLAGYIVPLETSVDGKVTEFFLAPYVGACIHVPPPAPNQMIYVKIASGQRIDSIYDAYWIAGTLHTRMKAVGLNAAAYTLELKSFRRVR